jgi:putative phosphoribosyl transferase
MDGLFADRHQAGRLLAERLTRHRGRPGLVVLGLPRGGIPVAYEVARQLHAALDVLLVRKLGVPWNEELAMGAIASGGVRVLDHRLIDALGVRDADIDEAVGRETRRIAEQERLYHPARMPLPLRDRPVIIIDDGVATGATMIAAVAAARSQHPASVLVAAPVAAPEARQLLQELDRVEEVVFVLTPEAFSSVGRWYRDFSPTTDEEVRRLLGEAEAASSGAQRGGP